MQNEHPGRAAMARAAATGDITLRSAGSSARSSIDPNPSSDAEIWAAARARAAEMRTWPINDPDGTVGLLPGAGRAVAKAPPPYIRQTLHEFLNEDEHKGKGKGKRSPWDRARRVFRGDQQSSSPSTSPAHSSMPSLEEPDRAEQEIVHV